MENALMLGSFGSSFLQNQQTEGLLTEAVRRGCYEAVIMLLDFSDAIQDALDTDDGVLSESSKGEKKKFSQGLIIAAQNGDAEIIRLFLSRGYTINKPHDLDCSCLLCVTDPLGQSKARIEILKAISNPIWVALTADDAFLTIFKLSKASKTFGRQEDYFENVYQELTKKSRQFCLDLLDQIETKEEELVIMNFGGVNSEMDAEKNDLKFIKLAIEYHQKEIVSHPIPQHVITSMVFDNIPKWRTSGLLYRSFYITMTALMFPITSLMFILCPCSPIGKSAKRPLIKFINGAASFVTLLGLLAIMSTMPRHGLRSGETPTIMEVVLFIWIVGLFVQEIFQLISEGQKEYFSSGWNWIDISMIFLMLISYVLWGALYFIDPNGTQRNSEKEKNITSTADGFFALAIVLSFFRMVYLCQITRFLGLLQLCLGRMVQVIFQFAFISLVVLWSFTVGMVFLYNSRGKAGETTTQNSTITQVLSGGYNGLPATMVTLAWASMSMVGLKSLEEFDDGTLIYFWSAFLFTLYHGVAMIVLLNMLIAMMSNSYQQIENNIEVEHKFARTKLWCEYIGDDNNVLPCPFNIVPSATLVSRCRKVIAALKKARWRNAQKEQEDSTDSYSIHARKKKEARKRYKQVCKKLLSRYMKRKHNLHLSDPCPPAPTPPDDAFLRKVAEKVKEWTKSLATKPKREKGSLKFERILEEAQENTELDEVDAGGIINPEYDDIDDEIMPVTS